jgi:hypothetical protein
MRSSLGLLPVWALRRPGHSPRRRGRRSCRPPGRRGQGDSPKKRMLRWKRIFPWVARAGPRRSPRPCSGCAARGRATWSAMPSPWGELISSFEGRLTPMFVLRRAFLKTMSTAVASVFITPTLLRAPDLSSLNQTRKSNMEIKRIGTQPSSKGPADWRHSTRIRIIGHRKSMRHNIRL